MGLEQNRLALARDAAAIDEVFYDVAYFRDVGMRRNGIAIRQNEAREGRRIFFENRAEIG
jgi:hypothetical protein